MKKNNKKGFTLVELVIVVAVMAILVAVAIPTVSYVTKSAQDAVNNSNCQTIESMLKLAEAEVSKSGKDFTGLSDNQIAYAVVNAKLGITEGTYVYNPKTGAVTYGTSAKDGEKSIAFSTTGVKVGTGSEVAFTLATTTLPTA